MLWQEYTLDFESQELPASCNLDKWENVFYQNQQARTFPEVVPGSRKWNAGVLKYIEVLTESCKNEAAIIMAPAEWQDLLQD